ncbi:MAG TPA: DNA replication/repair protein RecF [Sphingomonas sp.]|jgi:DNA replication and repair protein RecF|uniref:DNA replication/repair protein RecF n=1 Tax=Sphingomonas sp. TaxID=28214 RepID=UPI002ED848FF
MLSRLVLTDFRNHAALTLDAGPGFVVLTGENGSGKTNILEAVSLLAPGRGLRRADLSDMARQGGAGGFGVAATLGGDGDGDGKGDAAERVEIATGTLAAAPERRVVRVQTAPATAASLPEWLTVLWLTPATDRLFVEPAGERRRFLDRLALALAPAHATHAARYEAAMRARNRLLAEGLEGARPDPDWLSALEAQMAEHGAAVDAARRETVALLGARLATQAAGPFARGALALEGWSGEAGALLRSLREGRARDAAAGRALTGPHRADLIVTHLDKDRAAAMASTGEQKALLLGLVLAHGELVAERTGRAPVLLLDEVAAHLDPSRRAALFDRLAGRGQVWMTGTEPALFDAVGAGATQVALGG